MEKLSRLLQDNEIWLTERVLSYAKRQGYTRNTSTLLDAWRLSISGLSAALCMALEKHGEEEPQFFPDEDYTSDPVTEFGRVEAGRHRERGINISMFLGLLKYYRDSYIDLVVEKGAEEKREAWTRFVLRSFDRFEISLCAEWVATGDSDHIAMIEETTRRLANEKNRYLTLFESTPRPTFFVDKEGLLGNLNLAASHLLGLGDISGEIYYSGGQSSPDRTVDDSLRPVTDYLPWLEDDTTEFRLGTLGSHRVEKETRCFGALRYFEVFFARMLDVSEKFSGILIIIDDVTERKMLEARLNHLASTDALTGANNRHCFLRRGEEEISRSQRYGRPLSLLMLDIDYFKKINDTYGHAAGDDVLRSLSLCCRKIFRKTDVFGRIGGEEFAAVLPETALAEAEPVAERIRQELEQLKIDSPEGCISFTVSVGVVERQGDQHLADVMYFADKALYRAKHLGRNRVVSEKDMPDRNAAPEKNTDSQLIQDKKS